MVFVLGDVGPSFAGNLSRTVLHSDVHGTSKTCGLCVVEACIRTVVGVQSASNSADVVAVAGKDHTWSFFSSMDPSPRGRGVCARSRRP